MRKRKQLQQKAVVPLLWRIYSTLAMMPLAALTFFVLFRVSGGQFPLEAGGSTDPYFFSTLFSLLVPFLVWLVIDKIMLGIVAKRPGAEIAADLAKDLAQATAVAAAEVVIDSALGGAANTTNSSSASGSEGKGGRYGGGGASGGY